MSLALQASQAVLPSLESWSTTILWMQWPVRSQQHPGTWSSKVGKERQATVSLNLQDWNGGIKCFVCIEHLLHEAHYVLEKKYCCCAASKWNTLAFPNSELAPQNGDKSLKKSASFLTWLSQCRHFCGKNDAGYLKFFCFLMICIPNSANYSICFSTSKQNRRNFMNNLYQTNIR